MKWLPWAGLFVVVALVGCTTPPGKQGQAGEQEAVAKLNEIDAKLTHEDGDTTKPVIKVDLSENAKVSKDTFAHLKKLEKLKELNLNNCKVSDEDLAQLKGLTNLETLFLLKTQVTDTGLEHLKGMKSLTWLDLTGTDISDAGLKHLEGLTKLEKLEIGKPPKVTDEGKEKLEKAIKGLKIM